MIRFFDILFSLIGLILLSPILLLIYFFVVFESKGGGFYIQSRVGKSGIDFKLIKFRSMRIDSDKKGLITIGGKDSRLTKVGCIIRRYKLDELPQLINVLKGEMSLVGPRPEVRKYVNLYSPSQSLVLRVKPGITDYASIEFVDENEILGLATDPEFVYINEIMPMKLKLNLRYIENRTIKIYFSIIFLTLVKICGKKV